MTGYWLGIAVVLAGLAVSIALHELGHFLPARRFGVTVTRFMIGFGPTLWSHRLRGTEFGIKALPLGGFVRLIGMMPPAGQSRLPAWYPRRLSRTVADARSASWAGVADPDTETGAFYRLTPARRLIIMLGGPVMNLLLAAVLVSVALVGLGLPGAARTLTQVLPCAPHATLPDTGASADGAAGRSCPPGQAASPAVRAGLVEGDEIVAVNGEQTATWSDVQAAITSRPGQQVRLTVVHGDTRRTVPVTLARVRGPQGSWVGYLGVLPRSGLVAQPWSSVPATLAAMTTGTFTQLARLPAGVRDAARSATSDQPRPAETSVVSVVGIGQVAGQIAAAAPSADTVDTRVPDLLLLLGSINVFLFAFNLLPVLPLDGGYALAAVLDAVRQRVARRRGPERPGPVDIALAAPVAVACSLLLIAAAAVIIVADLANPVSLF